MVSRTSAPLPRQYPDHPSGIPRFSPLPKKYDYSARRTINNFTVELVGFNATIEHFLAAAAILDQTAPRMMEVVGDLGVEEARRLVPYDTGATYDSIVSKHGEQSGTFGFRVPGSRVWWVEVGAQTFYAPFLEFGTINMTPRPFIGPAYDVMTAALIGSVRAILGAVLSANGAGLVGGSGPAGQVIGDERVKAPFTQFRTFLYSSAKALGDISIVGGRSVFGPLRAQMYSLARLMGDVGSTMNNTLSQRITHRLQGRVTGRLVGFGSATLSGGNTYSAFVGGAGAHRIYQRIAGQHSKHFAFGGGFISRFGLGSD